MNDYSELIKALREPCQYENCVLSKQAADAIEALSAENKMLREALQNHHEDYHEPTKGE